MFCDDKRPDRVDHPVGEVSQLKQVDPLAIDLLVDYNFLGAGLQN